MFSQRDPYVSHGAWEARLDQMASVADPPNPYNPHYPSGQPPPQQQELELPPEFARARQALLTCDEAFAPRAPLQSAEARRQYVWGPSPQERRDGARAPLALEAADGAFERRMAARAAGEAVEAVEGRIQERLRSLGAATRAATDKAEDLAGENTQRRVEIASCAKVASAHELALDVLRHDAEARRAWFSIVDAERAENADWRRREDDPRPRPPPPPRAIIKT